MAELGMTQAKLAAKARVSTAALREIQHAVPKDRNPRTLAAISEALRRPPLWLEEVAGGDSPEVGDDRVSQLAAEVAALRERVERLEGR
ncbi:helix-turn-helix domain-containing protein [Amycolatopsis nigrescens]|uniref:helix-turn-helix domain-containing protein n=1 Tax=Amycolatopsis nigrescens TaxID=381445 RepID=UPI000377242A|nr:helix-turn-helix transcriptional regulator [Amycolatopsis nigrescens]